ncbi:MAG: TRAP transporter large permease [Bacillota bacterium]|nr:TRAP transporter large permease [Bacillota bacterium]
MSPVEAGIAGIILLLVLFFLRMPIAFAMAFVGMIGFGYIVTWSAGTSILARDFFGQFYSYSLSAITMFVLMGSFAFVSGIGDRLYKAAYSLVGDMRGGLGIATIMGCAGFAAICGSTSATAATMGRIVLPEMRKYGYDDGLATGTVASAGTLGILIPPSTVFIVYGFLTEQSIGKLFVAGVFPGLILAILFSLTVYLICRINPKMGPRGEKIAWREKLKALTQLSEALLLFALVIGGLFLGWFSPVEAGGIGAAGALIIGLLRRSVTWPKFVEFTKDGLRTATMIICLITGAMIFGRFMAVTTIPFIIADWVEGLPLPPVAIMGVIVLIFLLGGCFMDAMALITLVVPVIYPVVIRIGFDPILFGVIIVLMANLGVITPPVGVNVYVIKAISPNTPLEKIFKGTMPFLAAILITTILVIVFPQIALFLTEYAKY